MRFNRRSFVTSALAFPAATIRAGAATPTPNASPVATSLPDEDGYELWLRYRPVADATLLASYRAATAHLVNLATGPIAAAITEELDRACDGMLGQRPAVGEKVMADGTILVGTTKALASVLGALGESRLPAHGDEGYLLRSVKVDGFATTMIVANHERGLLYGVFSLIRLMQFREAIASLNVNDAPKANIRMVNHWDDMDRTVERGYAGLSIFRFPDLTAHNQRYEDYARLLASLGINGTVINDVNASANFLDRSMMAGYTSLATILRKWGVKLFLSVNFASPIDLTNRDAKPITTADPLDAGVRAWWKAKIDEIYHAVPDFGGFLVKANSEGEPGPLTYRRTHAQGANMFADALKPHGGIVIWRSFVHRGFKTWSEFEFRTFQPLDGEFADNAIVQTKNGPIDFLMREPVNPLFGAMPRTNQMIELQITQEYTGHATHVCFLPSYWRTVLDFETHYDQDGPTVAQIIDGTADNQPLTGFAGVINFGDDRNWTGSFLAAANTYGFGRLAWDHALTPEHLATEWTKLTFGDDAAILPVVVPMLTGSWRTYEQYTAPFGVGYLMRPDGAHYSPDPLGTLHWSHFTDQHGSGYDRTLATGTGFTRLYSDYWYDRYEHLESCPEELLMFMHIVPWDHTLAGGTTAIQRIYDDHFTGVDTVQAMQTAWQDLKGRIDHERFTAIAGQFDRHLFQSKIWRDVLLSYYFDNARTVSTSRPWVQLEMGVYPTLLLGGIANTINFSITNATPKRESLRVGLAPGQAGWKAPTVETALSSRESALLSLSVQPPLEPYLGPIVLAGEPATTTLGFDTQIVIVTPAAAFCTYAFDIGSRDNGVVTGYRALVSGDHWSGSASYGWVGTSPHDGSRTGRWDLLQNDFATASEACTLRLRLPAGKQRAWVLIGGQGTGTQPVRVRDGRTTLVDSGYLEESAFQWFGFTLDGGASGATVDLTFEGADGRVWRLGALVVLKPGL